MNTYKVKFEGLTPLIMHQDNLSYSEKITEWRIDPANKENSKSGDDRTPPWTWIGYLYHDGKHVGIPSDNLMTMLREGGAKVMTGKGKETYKKQSQSGIMIYKQQFDFFVNGKKIPVNGIKKLIGNMKFINHIELAESLGFQLFVKRAKVGMSKHIRVRPLFENWSAEGELTVIDEELSGITEPILDKILKQAGSMCGLCDWRPNSPRSPGSYGMFKPTIELI